MTDLEITKACAEAMGVRTVERAIGPHSGQAPALQLSGIGPGPIEWYDPLHDDAQAMALVKRFGLAIVCVGEFWEIGPSDDFSEPHCSTDLNRAICECVAKMRDK